jgi:hypothetical protein
MIGERAYRYAIERRNKLREELDEIERFLAVCERYAGAESHSSETPTRHEATASFNGAGELKAVVSVTAATIESGRRRGPRSMLPDETLHKYIRDILLERGPLLRHALVAELQSRGIALPESKDLINWLGTRIYRSKDLYVQLHGQGYWPADVPNPKLGYTPDDTSVTAAPTPGSGGMMG